MKMNDKKYHTGQKHMLINMVNMGIELKNYKIQVNCKNVQLIKSNVQIDIGSKILAISFFLPFYSPKMAVLQEVLPRCLKSSESGEH